MNENENKIKTQEYYINGIEQHLLAGRIQLLQSRRCRGREIGRFSPPRIFDDATGISVESVGDAALHLRHIILTESVSLVQVNLQTLLRGKAESALCFRRQWWMMLLLLLLLHVMTRHLSSSGGGGGCGGQRDNASRPATTAQARLLVVVEIAAGPERRRREQIGHKFIEKITARSQT